MEVDVLTVVASVLPFVLRDDPIRQHDSVLTGRLYYREIMNLPSSHRFSNVARMDKETFILLKSFLAQHGNLRRSQTINVGQKVMIFVHVLIGHTNRQTAERWQHSWSTISLIVHEVRKHSNGAVV